MGLSEEQWKAGQPALSDENARALAIWRFCDGWRPECLPLAFAYFDVDDPEFVIEQLIVLRTKIEAHQAAQRKHG